MVLRRAMGLGAVMSTVSDSGCYSGTVWNRTILPTGIAARFGNGLPRYNNLIGTQ